MSTPVTRLPLLPTHDPSGGSDKRTIKIPLPSGVSLLQASTLTVYNSDWTLLAGSDFEITDIEIGEISDGLFGVNFWPYKGTGLTGVIITLTPYYSDSLPGKPGEDISVRLPIGET
jgi:hypothetical protein